MISEYLAAGPAAIRATPCSSVLACTVASPSCRTTARSRPPAATSSSPPSKSASEQSEMLSVSRAESQWNGIHAAMLFRLARRKARQIEKASLVYGVRRRCTAG